MFWKKQEPAKAISPVEEENSQIRVSRDVIAKKLYYLSGQWHIIHLRLLEIEGDGGNVSMDKRLEEKFDSYEIEYLGRETLLLAEMMRRRVREVGSRGEENGE